MRHDLGNGRGRWAVALLLCLPLLVLAQDHPLHRRTAGPQGPMTLAVELPAGPTVSLPGGIPVVVTVTLTSRVRGELRVALDDGTPLVMPVEAGEGTYRYEWRMEARDPEARRPTLTVELQRADTAEDPLVVTWPLAYERALSADEPDQKLTVLWLSTRPVTRLFRDTNPAGLRSVDMLPASCPQAAETLRGFDVIVVTDDGLAPLLPVQVAALRDWAHQGGRLVIAGDAVRDEVKAAEQMATLGVTLDPVNPKRETLRIPGVALMNRDFYEESASERRDPMVKQRVLARPIALDEKRCEPGTLSVSRPLGFGRIVVTPVCLYDTLAQQSSKNYYEPMVWVLYELAGQSYVRATIGLRRDTSIHSSQVARRGLWGQVLNERFELEPISRRVVGGYLLLFALLATVGDRIALRLLRRPHWTWVTTVALIVAFAVAARWISRVSRGWDDRRRSITIMDIAPDGSTAYTYMDAVMPSTRRQYAITLPDGGTAMAQALSTGDRGSLRRNPVGTDSVLHAQAPVWTPIIIAAQHPGGQAEAAFDADLVWEGERLTGRIRAADGAAMADVALCYRGTRYTLEPDGTPGGWNVAAPMELSRTRDELRSGRPASASSARIDDEELDEREPIVDPYRALVAMHHYYETPLPRPDISIYSVSVEQEGRAMLQPFALRGSTEDDDVAWILARTDGGPRLHISPDPGDASGELLIRQLVHVTVVSDTPASPGDRP